MDTQDNAGGELPLGQFVCHPYLRGRTRAAAQVWYDRLHYELAAERPAGLAKATKVADRAYQNTLLRSGGIW